MPSSLPAKNRFQKLADDIEKDISTIAALLRTAKSILFITGAGISADSGLPTYRGIGGLYEGALTEDGISVEDALSGEMLRSDPAVTWKYLSQIEHNCRGASFNRGHEVIAQMEKHFERVWVLTQNIDGFHQNAGSKNVIDIHGNIHQLLCTRCDWRKSVEDFSKIKIPPLCPQCGSPVRPDVVFFGEELPEDKVAALHEEEVLKGFDLYFSIGTSSLFPYIKGPMVHAIFKKKPTIEINPGTTEISDSVDIKLSMGAAEALDRIWEEYQEKNL